MDRNRFFWGNILNFNQNVKGNNVNKKIKRGLKNKKKIKWKKFK